APRAASFRHARVRLPESCRGLSTKAAGHIRGHSAAESQSKAREDDDRQGGAGGTGGRPDGGIPTIPLDSDGFFLSCTSCPSLSLSLLRERIGPMARFRFVSSASPT